MKKIGILSWKIGENSFGITNAYLNWIEYFGQVRILDYKEPFDASLDLLVLPGGPDVNPERYKHIPDRSTGKPCVHREYFDMYTLPHYVQNLVPIFGICRGHQTLNVHFGGTLNQHMYHETSFKSRSELVHEVRYKIKSDGKTILYTNKVNSLHHQVIDEVGKDLRVVARYHDKNRLYDVEALIHEQLPIASVQYHPEELHTDNLANSLMYDLLENVNIADKYLEV
ncbi:MAG: gamma-glutamyl-gamma-aminobutyrate hydrolase family protein [Nanoarchaeota archaeon]